MTQDTIKQSYRGVRCLSCRQPIPLPAILIQMESAAHAKESSQEQQTRVFSLRCRSCEREKPYRATDVIEFEGIPKPRLSRSGSSRTPGRQSGSQSMAASG